jgi:hypothetical protein
MYIGCRWAQSGTYVDCRWAQLFMHACCSGKSRVYAGCSGAKRVCTRVAIRRIIYIVFLVGEGMYMQTSDVIKFYRWSGSNLWVEEVSSKLLRFGFLICMVIGG